MTTPKYDRHVGFDLHAAVAKHLSEPLVASTQQSLQRHLLSDPPRRIKSIGHQTSASAEVESAASTPVTRE
jgi:hypothetical protein